MGNLSFQKVTVILINPAGLECLLAVFLMIFGTRSSLLTIVEETRPKFRVPKFRSHVPQRKIVTCFYFQKEIVIHFWCNCISRNTFSRVWFFFGGERFSYSELLDIWLISKLGHPGFQEWATYGQPFECHCEGGGWSVFCVGIFSDEQTPMGVKIRKVWFPWFFWLSNWKGVITSIWKSWVGKWMP